VKWTAEQDEALRKHRSLGLSSAQVAWAINQEFRTSYSRNAIIGRLYRLGVTTPMAVKPVRKTAAPRKEPERKPRPAPPRLPPEEIELRAADVVPRHLPLLELRPDDCKYPYGNGPFSFCGNSKAPGSSYCFEHDCLTRRA